MDLKFLTDKQLLLDIKLYAFQEREIITVILHHLNEIDSRKLFSELKYSSMLDYAVKELKYSETAAIRRLQSASLLKDFPQLENKILKGELTLSNLQLSYRFFRKQEIKDPHTKLGIINQIESLSSRDCQKLFFELTPMPLPQESIRPVSKEHYQLKINVTEATLKSLEDVKNLIAFPLIDDAFLSKIAKEAKKSIERERFKVSEKGKISFSAQGGPLTNFEKRETWEKSSKCCENCGSFFDLQVDHTESKSQGGTNDLSNLRILCFNCNQRARINSRL